MQMIVNRCGRFARNLGYLADRKPLISKGFYRSFQFFMYGLAAQWAMLHKQVGNKFN